MNAFWDKLLHFATGIAVGVGFWWGLERYTKQAARTINPIMFLVVVVAGQCGGRYWGSPADCLDYATLQPSQQP